MRKLFLTVLFACATCFASYAQLEAPVQVDTFDIVSMKYNYNEVSKENWPFRVVYRSTTGFTFGKTTFSIVAASEGKWSSLGDTGIRYEMSDGSRLYQRETESSTRIVYSNYDITCIRRKDPMKNSGTTMKDTSLTAQLRTKESTDADSAIQSAGDINSRPSARLDGRMVDKAGLKKPLYKAQEEGTVVVKIWVDRYGKVRRAAAGADGTTLTDKALWRAAMNAALETGFNMKADAPELQEGAITYIFRLK